MRTFSQGLESVAGYKNFFQKNISRLGLKNGEKYFWEKYRNSFRVVLSEEI